MNILKVFLLSFALLFVFGVVTAQEEAPIEEVVTTAEETVTLDEDVQPQDLGVSEPTLLPDNPFYFFKNLTRGVQSFFTFNPVAKAELKLKFANEKLIEVKKLAEKIDKPEIIKKAVENYGEEIDKIKEATEKIRVKAEENERLNSFLDKFVQQQILHQRILQKLETQVPPQAFEKIQEVREKHLERFGEVMTKLENKEKIQERLEKNLEEIKGSEFKEFKNLEVLKELEEKVPEAAKEAIRKARENTLERLKNKLEQMPEQKIERFKQYIEQISGTEENRVEILENIKEALEEKPLLQQNLLQSRVKILERVSEKLEERNCPEIEKPTLDFCKEGRIVVKKDEKGCIVSFDCVIPAETPTIKPEGKACIALWDPVCGKDGKTYSNACFAKLAGVEIDYEGVCKNIQIKERLQRILPQTTP